MSSLCCTLSVNTFTFCILDEKQRFIVTAAERDYDHEIITEQRSINQIDAINWNLLSKYEVDSRDYPYLSDVEKLPAMQYYEDPVSPFSTLSFLIL